MISRMRPLLLTALVAPGCVTFDQGPHFTPARVSGCQPCGEVPHPSPAPVPIRLAEPQELEAVPVPIPVPSRPAPAPPPPRPTVVTPPPLAPPLTPMADPPSASVPKRRTWTVAKPVRST
jgi:hypothetical protein